MTASLRASEQDANSGLIAPEYTSLLLPVPPACRAVCLIASLACTATFGQIASRGLPAGCRPASSDVSALGSLPESAPVLSASARGRLRREAAPGPRIATQVATSISKRNLRRQWTHFERLTSR